MWEKIEIAYFQEVGLVDRKDEEKQTAIFQ